MSNQNQTAEVLSVSSEPSTSPSTISSYSSWLIVLVAGLGYFVDVFDMWLFANFRVASLEELGLNPDQITKIGAHIINYQQAGFILGGFVWGMLGDKRGRASVMFGSILLYSLSTLACAFVQDTSWYTFLRFITGFGLAGEIGAGITLVSEVLSKEKRGYGTTLVATLGVFGAVIAALVGKYFYWRTAYIIGGVMGLLLLLMRVLVHESGMFSNLKQQDGIKRGSLKMLFGTPSLLFKYIMCIVIGVPIYAIFGILGIFAPEICGSLGIEGKISVPDVLLYSSIGITVGDLASGLLSQRLKSRKKPLLLFNFGSIIALILFASGFFRTQAAFLMLMCWLGIMVGYWACLITTSAEQFGTNIRATVTTTIPNLIRGSAILLNMLFISWKEYFGAGNTALMIAIFFTALSILCTFGIRETYGKELDYTEK